MLSGQDLRVSILDNEHIGASRAMAAVAIWGGLAGEDAAWYHDAIVGPRPDGTRMEESPGTPSIGEPHKHSFLRLRRDRLGRRQAHFETAPFDRSTISTWQAIREG